MSEILKVYNSIDTITIQMMSDNKLPIGIAEASYLEADDCYYFNRLYVNPKYRTQHYGTKLLNSLLDCIDSMNESLLLDINPYGDMTYNDLKEFYMRHGFVKFGERFIYKTGGRKCQTI